MELISSCARPMLAIRGGMKASMMNRLGPATGKNHEVARKWPRTKVELVHKDTASSILSRNAPE